MSQQVIAKIVDMLSDERIERRCAAAMVLGELRVKDERAAAELCACLGEDVGPLHLYALEALAAMRAKKLAAAVAPLLDSPDAEVRARARALLASQGKQATAALAKELVDAPPARQRAIVSILARQHTAETFERLLGLLGEPETGEAVLNILRGELDQMDAAPAKLLREALVRRLKDKQWGADALRASRTVRLLGYYRDAKLVATLLPYAAAKQPAEVRLAALAGLRRPLQAARAAASALKALFVCADDEDERVARAAVDTLRAMQLDGDATASLTALARGRHAEARRFALAALGSSGNAKAAPVLLEHLAGSDPATREVAAKGLVSLAGNSLTLIAALERLLDDPPALGRLCTLLRSHVATLDAKVRARLAELAVGALQQDRPAAEPLLSLLRLADPRQYAAALAELAAQHRRAGRPQQAFALLARVDEAGLLDDEGRYAALVSGLQALSSKKDLGRTARTTDPVLRQAVALLTQGYPLARKLVKDKGVVADDLFFVGFNFAESKDADQREFGGDLLGHLVSTAPRSKLGRSAKNKLRLVGLEA